MSTKNSIKARHRTGSEWPGFHLYDDVLDALGQTDGDTEPPVDLRLDGVAVQLETLNSEGVAVMVSVPREMASELGLPPLEDGRRPTRNS